MGAASYGTRPLPDFSQKMVRYRHHPWLGIATPSIFHPFRMKMELGFGSSPTIYDIEMQLQCIER